MVTGGLVTGGLVVDWLINVNVCLSTEYRVLSTNYRVPFTLAETD